MATLSILKMHTNNAGKSLQATLLGLSCLLFISGCAEKEVAPAFYPDPKAYEFALTNAIKVQQYTKHCARIDGALTTLASQAKKRWEQANWPQTQVSDKRYTQKLQGSTVVYNGQTIALPAVKLYLDIEKSVSGQLDRKRQSHSSLVSQCKFQLNNIFSGQLDISKDNNADLYLKSLVTNTGPAYKVPSLAAGIDSYLPVGTSHYTASKIIRQSGCQFEETYTLKNERALEDYVVACANNGKIIQVSCELGQCTAKYLN